MHLFRSMPEWGHRLLYTPFTWTGRGQKGWRGTVSHIVVPHRALLGQTGVREGSTSPPPPHATLTHVSRMQQELCRMPVFLCPAEALTRPPFVYKWGQDQREAVEGVAFAVLFD